MGSEGSGNVLKLSVGGGGLLGAPSWGAHGVCKGGIAKSYLWELAVEGALSATMSILFSKELLSQTPSQLLEKYLICPFTLINFTPSPSLVTSGSSSV